MCVKRSLGWHRNCGVLEVKAVSYKFELEFQIYTKFAQNSPSQFVNTRDSYDYVLGND